MYNYKHNVTQIHKVPPIYVRRHWAYAELMAHHFTCPNVLNCLQEIPVFVGITVAGVECEIVPEHYLEPYRSLKQPRNTLALSTQVAYGSVNAELIIEWIEAYRYLGVDKIVSHFTEDINEKAFKVLLYYHNLNLIDLYCYIPAAEGTKLSLRMTKPTKWHVRQANRSVSHTPFGSAPLPILSS